LGPWFRAEKLGDLDLVLELIGGDYAQRSIPVLRPGGLLVTAVERTNLELAAQVERAGRRFAGVTVEPDYRGLEQLATWVEQEKLRVHVSETFPLAEVAAAHRRLERSLLGKIVLRM
jgi:NADPH:quinone reductase-like Zn-dependent oxidoreductase